MNARASSVVQTVSGVPEAIDLTISAPWTGHNHTINIHFDLLPVSAGSIVISKNCRNRDGSLTWQANCATIDPLECETTDIWFMTQVGLNPGESIQVEYANPDDREVSVEVILEGA